MTNILKLSLAAVAIASLAACGDGGSSDAADAFVGNWKSNCYSYVSTSGGTYYATQVMSLNKASASVLAATNSANTAYSDSACKSALGALTNASPTTISLGADITYSGAASKAMVMTLTDGQARQGYITASATNLSLVVTGTDGKLPTSGWGSASPYTKQ